MDDTATGLIYGIYGVSNARARLRVMGYGFKRRSVQSMKLELMRALAEMSGAPKYATRVYGRHRIRYARWQAEQDKIFAGTHHRIEDARPFGRRKSGRPKKQLNDHVWQIPKAERERCGAKTRAGEACRRLPVPGRARCANHGGLSTGPKTEAGRAAIAASNRKRAKRAA